MKILLFNPWIVDVKAYDFWLKPVGLLILGNWLKASGHEVRLIDCLDRQHPWLSHKLRWLSRQKENGTGKFFSEPLSKPGFLGSIPRTLKRYGLPFSVVEEQIKEGPGKNWMPDRIFVTSMMTYWYPGAWEAVSLLKKQWPHTPVYLGGVYASLLADHAQNSGADAVCAATRPHEVLDFIRNQGICVKTPDSWLIPEYTLYGHPLSHLVYITSLGCPYRCSYCATPQLQDPLFLSPGELCQYIALDIARSGSKNVAFFDDAILMNHQDHFEMLLEGLIVAGIPDQDVKFHLPNGIHARLLTRKVARLMKRAHFQTVRIGLETMDENRQTLSGGKLNQKDFLNAVEILQQEGFTDKEISAYVMVNLPGQTLEEIERSIQACFGLGINVHINEYTPIPSTADYRQWLDTLDEGSIRGDIDPLMTNNAILPYWWKEGLSIDNIQKLKDSLNLIRRKSTIC